MAGAQNFEIADVHESAPGESTSVRGGVLRGERYEIYNATLLDLILIAHTAAGESIIGKPRWLYADLSDRVSGAPSCPSNTPAAEAAPGRAPGFLQPGS